MCIHRFVILAASCCLLSLGGLAAADTARTVQDINAVADTVNQVVQSPVGRLIPEPFQTIIMTAVMVVSTILGIWFKKQKNVTMKALSSVVNGIETAHPESQANVKNCIANQMDATGKYDQLNAIVDKAKNA